MDRFLSEFARFGSAAARFSGSPSGDQASCKYLGLHSILRSMPSGVTDLLKSSKNTPAHMPFTVLVGLKHAWAYMIEALQMPR